MLSLKAGFAFGEVLSLQENNSGKVRYFYDAMT